MSSVPLLAVYVDVREPDCFGSVFIYSQIFVWIKAPYCLWKMCLFHILFSQNISKYFFKMNLGKLEYLNRLFSNPVG